MVMPYGRGKDLEWDMDPEVMMKRSVEIDENSLMYEKISWFFKCVFARTT